MIPDKDFLQAYDDFLNTKAQRAPAQGFEVKREDLHQSLKPHQADFTAWALHGGRRGIFASFGLGKTRIQCEIQRQINKKTVGNHLIICPLGVKHEFEKEGAALSMKIQYVRTQAEVEACASPFMITNYERIVFGDIDTEQFASVCLDEASVLRTSNSKTHHFFLQRFRNTRFRYVATATPSPNDYIELLYYAEFLGIMTAGEAKTRFFKRNSQKADKLEIYPHKEQEFWLWVASWSCFLTKPSDFGYDDEGYELPQLHVHYHLVESDHANAGHDRRNGQMRLLRESSLSAVDASREKRDTISARLEKSLEIMSASNELGEHWLLWHHLEDERRAIEKALPDARAVYGSQPLETREGLIDDFSEGRIRILATKPEIAGSGCNFQRHCSRAIFMGVDYKFNDIIQAVHRIYRFLQNKEVHVHFIYSEAEAHVLETFKRKWAQHDALVSNMRAIIAEYGLSGEHIKIHQIRSKGVARLEERGKSFTALRNDSVLELAQTEAQFDMVISSIPFSIMYEYSYSFEDFGNNFTNEDFFKQMDFILPNMYRALKPGRIAAIHVKDRVLFGNFTGFGFPTIYPFSDRTREAFERHGFAFMARITVTTDVVRENNQTYRLGWTECSKDATKMGAGLPEYVLLFRKPPSDSSDGYADEPVLHEKDFYTRAQWQIDAHGFWKSSGNRLLTREELRKSKHGSIQKWWSAYDAQHLYDYEKHVELSNELEAQGMLPYTYMLLAPQSNHSDVWSDIIRMRTLNGSQAHRNLVQHICPMQFDIVNRLIERFTNPGEMIADPFSGLGTVGYCAIKKGRKAWLCELNENYFSDGLGYLRAAEAERNTPTLFDDLLEPELEESAQEEACLVE